MQTHNVTLDFLHKELTKWNTVGSKKRLTDLAEEVDEYLTDMAK